nr:hypothetical protein [Tanacetum cinerariifolium]
DSLKNWNNRFIWVDECVFPTAVEWRTNSSKDGMPANGTYSVEANLLRFERAVKEVEGIDANAPPKSLRRDHADLRPSEIKNLEALLETEAGMKRAAEEKSDGLSQELERMRAKFSELQVSHERLSQQVDALQQQCAESLEMRQAFADVVSAGVAKGMSEGLKHGVEHGYAQRTVESLEAYDPEAEAKFATALYSSQLTIPVYPEVRDPRNPWACKEEIGLAGAIAANISRAEQKKRNRIVCRTHGVGSTHHVRSDRVPVSAPIVVPQGLALLLVDATTQTESDA